MSLAVFNAPSRDVLEDVRHLHHRHDVLRDSEVLVEKYVNGIVGDVDGLLDVGYSDLPRTDLTIKRFSTVRSACWFVVWICSVLFLLSMASMS